MRGLKKVMKKALGDPYKTFPKRNLRALYKFFPGVPKPFVESVYDLFFFGSVGVLAMFGDDKFSEMMAAYQEFLSKCEAVADKAIEEDKQKLEENEEVKVSYWVSKANATNKQKPN